MTNHPPEHEAQKDSNDLVLSFLALRRFLGYLGAALPISMLAWAQVSGLGLQPSISDFYYTPMGDLLVGILSAIGVFFLCYKGFRPLPHEWLTDRRVATVAGFAALGVALFPVRRIGQPPCPWDEPGCITFGSTLHPNVLHYGSAFVFFACLALFCLILFTRGDRTEDGKTLWTPRNLFYASCGTVILISMAAMLVYFFAPDATKARLTANNYIFWWETAGIIAFAASWLVKGKAPQTLAKVGADMMHRMRS
ncbi:MAG: hypothetical protein ACRC14_04850 [Paracoccaceae bacterium]